MGSAPAQRKVELAGANTRARALEAAISGLKNFSPGELVDLAVALVLGAAFGAIVTSWSGTLDAPGGWRKGVDSDMS